MYNCIQIVWICIAKNVDDIPSAKSSPMDHKCLVAKRCAARNNKAC